MNGLIITGHGSFASGLQTSVKLIAGEQLNIEYVDFVESDSTADLEKKLNGALNRLEEVEGVLFLCDLVGGSPFKTAVTLSVQRPDAAVIGGANLAMIIETAIMKDNLPIEELKTMAVNSGKAGIKAFEAKTRSRQGNGAGI